MYFLLRFICFEFTVQRLKRKQARHYESRWMRVPHSLPRCSPCKRLWQSEVPDRLRYYRVREGSGWDGCLGRGWNLSVS